MMPPVMSEEFRQSLRTELVHRAERAQANTRARHWRWITGGTLGVLLAGGATFAAADLFNQPGAPVTSTVADEVTVTGTGTRTIDLGPAPESATGVWVDIRCLMPAPSNSAPAELRSAAPTWTPAPNRAARADRSQ